MYRTLALLPALLLVACLADANDARRDAATDSTAGPDSSQCVPDCVGRVCGDDGCGGSCGACEGSATCSGGACLCLPACDGRTCGDDGCGGSCGACDGNATCVSGACACEPACEGRDCGDDGCGGTCGTCEGCFGPAPDACAGGVCETTCCADCGDRECGDDGCGGSCGSCDGGDTCIEGACACEPDCGVRKCGDDGCGGSCGSCDEGWGCSAGTCVEGCVADCGDRDCGDDGCGGSCGGCGDGQRCEAGQCDCAPRCEGKQCGPDGCGGSCGDCPTGACGGDGKCACAPSCEGKQCGPNGCGGSCGGCDPGQACGDDGTCACAPSCGDRLCGTDGCGGSCGGCEGGTTCVEGQCACVADCGSDPVRVCGGDGCGGSCGDCEGGEVCSGGLCVPPTDAVHTLTIGDWTMSPGAETTRCVVKRLDNPTDIVITSIETKLSPGSHHMIVYRSAETTERTTPFSCTPFLETLGSNAGPLMITQVAEETLTFPPGVGMRLEAGQMIRIEAHFFNYYPNDITAHGDVEFHTAGAEQVTDLADFLFYGKTALVIPPGQYTSPWLYLDAPNGAKVFGITGHTHQYGTNVETRVAQGSGATGTQIYPGSEPFDWAEAPLVTYDPPIEIGTGTGFKIRCSWNNTTNGNLYFGESANQEMCFIWAYYYPSQGYRICSDGIFAFLCDNDG
ncbi:MAG: hypothetical protein IT385_10780 [Deltaproteobacteria bacterium]|nr:hypothetical protein [Deltaproteobacteria bacterium]